MRPEDAADQPTNRLAVSRVCQRCSRLGLDRDGHVDPVVQFGSPSPEYTSPGSENRNQEVVSSEAEVPTTGGSAKPNAKDSTKSSSRATLSSAARRSAAGRRREN